MSSSVWQKALAALLVVTLLFSTQIAELLSSDKRFYLHWSILDSLALILLIGSLAGIALGFDLVLQRMKAKFLLRLYHHLFVLLLGAGIVMAVLVPLVTKNSTWNDVVILVWVAVVGDSLIMDRKVLVRYSKNLCLALSPLAAILFVQLLLVPDYERPEQPLEFPHAPRSASPVFIFVFDGWSYQQSTSDGKWLPFFHNLRDFERQSFVFGTAHSAGYRTRQSLPAMIYQTELDFTPDVIRPDGSVESLGNDYWTMEDLQRAPPNTRGIFELARQRDYNTVFIGFWLPFHMILGDQVDYCFGLPSHPKGSSLIERVIFRASDNLDYQIDPVSKILAAELNPRLFSRNYFQMANQVSDEIMTVLRDCPPNTLAMFHVPVPHWPYVYQPDGSYFGHQCAVKNPYGPLELEDYLRNLKYLDTLIGQFTQELQNAGKFQDAMIVLTADHGLRYHDYMMQNHDTDPLRVPLLVKIPRQSRSYVVNTPFTNYQLLPILKGALDGTVNAQLVFDAAGKSQ